MAWKSWDVHRILTGIVSELIGSSVGEALFHSGSGEPNGKSMWIMITPIELGSLHRRRSSKFTRPDHQSVIEQTTGLQIQKQSGNRLIHLGGSLRMVSSQIPVLIPLSLVRTVRDLHKTHPTLQKTFAP